jgi:hypothetical protein
LVISWIPYGSKYDVDQRARLLLAPGSPSYNNNKNSTYLQLPLRLLHNVFTKLFIIFSGVGDTQHHCQIPDGFLRKIIQILTILITDSHIWSCSLANSWIMILRLHPKTVIVLYNFTWGPPTYEISTFKQFLKEVLN